MDIKPREYIFEGLLAERSMAEIFSWRGVGKTWFALFMAVCAATERKFFKWTPPRPRRVLFVDGEMDAASLKQRLQLLDAQTQNLEIPLLRHARRPLSQLGDFPRPENRRRRARRSGVLDFGQSQRARTLNKRNGSRRLAFDPVVAAQSPQARSHVSFSASRRSRRPRQGNHAPRRSAQPRGSNFANRKITSLQRAPASKCISRKSVGESLRPSRSKHAWRRTSTESSNGRCVTWKTHGKSRSSNCATPAPVSRKSQR